jgi:hypothetical protein
MRRARCTFRAIRSIAAVADVGDARTGRSRKALRPKRQFLERRMKRRLPKP